MSTSPKIAIAADTNSAPDFDTIIIGSGIGGLTTAACLARSGKRVLVLERHYTSGGMTHTFARKGYRWDVGVHYIGEVHNKNSSLRRIFDYISAEQLQWQKMEKVYDRLEIEGKSFDFISEQSAFYSALCRDFPNDTTAIDRYFELLQEVNHGATLFFTKQALPRWLATILDYPLSKSFMRLANKSTTEVLSQLTDNQKLIAVLTSQWVDYGLPPDKSSFAMHAMVVKHYLGGASYPVGGAGEIAKAITHVIQNHGGQVVTRADVKEIMIANNKAIGVKLADGRVIRAKNVVSAVGVINTFRDLIPQQTALKTGYLANLNQVQSSMAHLCLYVGLKGTKEELGLKSTNQWHHDNTAGNCSSSDTELSLPVDLSIIYTSFPSTKDPHWSLKYRGKSTAEVVVPADYEHFQKWENTQPNKRGSEYETFKSEMAQKLLTHLLKKEPQLIGHVDYIELSTPLSTAHFCNYHRGEIYGLAHNPQRFRQRWLRSDTNIKNLFLTGQDIVTCGVGGACMAGALTAIRMLGPFKGLNIIKLFLNGHRKLNQQTNSTQH